MKQNITKYFYSIATLLSVAMLFSCETDIKKYQKREISPVFPQGEAHNFVLTYTDSAKVRSILRSPLNEDYTNQKFPYSEFPNGVTVDFFDQKNQKNVVSAKYGIIYPKTQMIELRDSVVLTTYDGKKLQTDQLFWDQKQDWVFTEKNFTFTDIIKGSVTKGVGMDFDKNFSTLKAHKVTGIVPIKEDEIEE